MTNKETIMTKLENGRADFAYKCVEEAVNILDDKKKKEYRSYARKIPQMILSNGLGQTLAFVYSKKENGNAYNLIYRQITDYMKSDSTARIAMPADEDELVKWVISLDSSKYQHATEEILAFLKWLKRFAEGMIEEEEGGEE